MVLRTWFIVLSLLLVSTPALAGEIHVAIEAGDLARVQSLVAADPDVVNQPRDSQYRDLPLHTAAIAGQVEIIDFLVENGAIVDGHDTDESTPLMVAANTNQAAAAKRLLELGAKVNQADLNGSTPLSFAVAAGAMDVIPVLEAAGADFTASFGNNSTYMFPAAALGDVDMLKMLKDLDVPVDSANDEGDAPLNRAAMRNRVEAVRWLLAEGADATRANGHGQTALLECAFRGTGEIAEMLIAAGAPIEKKDNYGRTPLFCAAWIGNEEVIAVLLNHHADPNAANESGQTPLIKAAEGGNLATINALLAAGAKVDALETKQGRQSLHIAAARGYADVAAVLIKSGSPLDTRDNSGASPIELASAHGNKQVISVLTKTDDGKTGKTKKCAGACKGSLQAIKTPQTGEAVVWYLGHSAMAVKTANNFLIFDYFEMGRHSDDPCLVNGIICPEEIAGQKVTVFASHVHGDHYDPTIFAWREKVEDITYILGFEPEDETTPAHETVGPRETRQFDNLTVHTIASNDSGVGFLVEVDGVSIFHAGDHANRNRDLSGDYCPEIDYLVAAGYHPDLTMLPTTGCNFGDQVAVRIGIDYTLEKFGPTTFFPMHARNNPTRYVEVWDEVGPKHPEVTAVIPRDNGDWYIYKTKKSM